MSDRLLSPKEAAVLVDAGALLVDVRTSAQVQAMTAGKTLEKAVVDPVDDWVTTHRKIDIYVYIYIYIYVNMNKSIRL